MQIEAQTAPVIDIGECHPLRAALAAQRALWPEPRIEVGALEPGWLTAAALFADDALLADHLEYQGSFDEGVDDKSRAAFLISDYCSMFCMSAVPLLVGAGLAPDFAPERYALQFYTRYVEHDGHGAELRRADVRFLALGFSTFRESEAAHPDAEALPGREALCARFRQGVEAHFTPLIEALHRLTRLPRAAMWRLVGDALGATFLDAGRRYGCLGDAKAVAMAVLKHPGSPLFNRQMHFVDVTLCDDACPARVLACHTFRARGGCCRWYLIGKPLCSTCVLHDDATRERLLRNTMRRRFGLPPA